MHLSAMPGTGLDLNRLALVVSLSMPSLPVRSPSREATTQLVAIDTRHPTTGVPGDDGELRVCKKGIGFAVLRLVGGGCVVRDAL